MGTYAYLTVGGYVLLETKGSSEPVALSLFDESDRREHPFYEGEDPIPIDYVSTAACIRDRLETMGSTLDRSREVFRCGIASSLADFEDVGEGVHESWEKRIALLRRLTFDDWLNAVRELKLNKITTWNYDGIAAELTGIDVNVFATVMNRDPDLFGYVLDRNEPFLGFPFDDFRVFLRADSPCAAITT